MAKSSVGGGPPGCMLVMQSNVRPHHLYSHLYSENRPYDFTLNIPDIVDFSDDRLSVAIAEVTVTTDNFPEQVRELLVYSNIAEYPRPFTGSCSFIGSYPDPSSSDHYVLMRTLQVRRGRTQTFTFDADKLWFLPFARHLSDCRSSGGHPGARQTSIKVLLKELDPSNPSRTTNAEYCVGVTTVAFAVRMNGTDTVLLKEDRRTRSGRTCYKFAAPLPSTY